MTQTKSVPMAYCCPKGQNNTCSTFVIFSHSSANLFITNSFAEVDTLSPNPFTLSCPDKSTRWQKCNYSSGWQWLMVFTFSIRTRTRGQSKPYRCRMWFVLSWPAAGRSMSSCSGPQRIAICQCLLLLWLWRGWWWWRWWWRPNIQMVIYGGIFLFILSVPINP